MIYNAMDRLHPNIVKQHVLNMGFEAGLTGFKKVKETVKNMDVTCRGLF